MDNSTIYEIFRACRLCGAGGGYKMPIIQDVVGVDPNDVELKQKIRDCVQIEVSQDDKMPPLICELCVDKVNDFYEFMEMCRQTNNKTRLRLGLPLQAVQETSDPGDCILGITETVYADDDEPPSRPRPKSLKYKSEQKNSPKEEKSLKTNFKGKESLKNELKKLIQLGSTVKPLEPRRKESRSSSVSSRASRSRPSPPPARETRRSDGPALSTLSRRLRNEQKKTEKPKDTTPKSILKKESRTLSDDDDDESLLVARTKRTREKELSNDVASKKVKITIKLPPPSKVHKDSKVQKDSKVDKCKVKDYSCTICGRQTTTVQGLTNHLKFHHTVTYTSPSVACNACGDWFENAELLVMHHKRYHKSRPYHCRWCKGQFKLEMTYNNHFEKNNCVPHPNVTHYKCKKCFKKFPSEKTRSQHDCPAKSGAACGECGRTYTTKQHLRRHQISCTGSRRTILDEVIIPASVRAQLLPMRVRLARCDDLLKQRRKCRASLVPFEHGLDPNTVYPYITSRVRIKSEPFVIDGMVSIKQEIKDELYNEEDYVHWDSELSSDDEDLCTDGKKDGKKRVERLSTLSLKTIFSRRCLGKVPRKLRKLKNEKFDLYNEFDMSNDINNIINNLGDDMNDKEGVDYDSDSLLDNNKDKNEKDVTNDDFDAVFANDIGKGSENSSRDVNDSQIGVAKEINDKNKDDVSMGSETDASIDDVDKIEKVTGKGTNVELMDTSNDKLDENVDENRNGDIEIKNNDSVDKNEEAAVSVETEHSGNTNNAELIDTANVDDNLDENNDKNQNGDVEKDNNKVKNDNVESEKCKSEKFYDKNDKSEKNSSEVDTISLMDELDAQIIGGYRNNVDQKSLENISDEEFNFDA